MTAVNKSAPEVHHKTTARETIRRSWRPETLTGKITMVDPVKRLVVVKGASEVPFDMIVTPSTRIRSGDQKLKLSDLASQTKKDASVKFVPERRGDVAQSIRVNG
jgi:hypothetical protein